MPDDKELVFNQEQLEFISSPMIDLKLIGIPGGGKTRCIIEKINKHFEKNEYHTTSDFMILSFSKRCRFDFIYKGKIYPKRFTKDNVKTLHSLSKTILNLFSDKNSSSLDTVIVAAKYLLDNCSFEQLENIECFKNIKTIYLDEAQDISQSQFELVYTLKKLLGCNLVMVGDPNQNIYQFQGGSDKFLLEFQAKTIYLKQNYRSTSNIVEFVNYISPNQENKMISSNNSENQPVNIYVNNIENIKHYILNIINTYQGDISDIAIIGPVRKSKPIMNQYLNLGLSFILNLLESNSIKYCKFFDDVNDNINVKCDDKITMKPNHINLLTIHGSKGLEFKKVIILNFHFYTFGIMPSIEDFNRFKYLWYVASSRAKQDMTLISLDSKMIWPLLENVPNNIYQINKVVEFKTLHFNTHSKPLNYGVTKILEDITPDQLFELEQIVKYSTDYQQIFMSNSSKILEYEEYSALYGNFIETCFQYFYTKRYYTEEKNIFKKYLENLNNGILIDKKYTQTIIKLVRRLNYQLTDVFNLSIFNKYKNKFNNNELAAFNYISTKLNNNLQNFTLIFQNDVIVSDLNHIKEVCNQMINNYNHIDYQINLFKIVLYKYQINNELGFLWKKDFSKHLESLSFYINQIETFVSKINTKMEFSVQTSHPNLPIIGEIDILENNDTIIDIKFTRNIHIKQILQLLLYYNNLFPD